MAEYIDREKLIAEYDRVHVGAAGGARKLMVDAPAEDVAPVVHWISVNDRLPESGVSVLLCCEYKKYGGGVGKYICDGYYAAARSIECGGLPDECACEYIEEDDEYYLFEGWYEVIKNWDEYSSVAIEDGDTVTHWMPLPDLPEEQCNHEFVYDELRGQIVCKKCFHVLTAEEKRVALEYANGLRRAEEADAE